MRSPSLRCWTALICAAASCLPLAAAQGPDPLPPEGAAAAERPPSVVFYLMDTCRDDRLSYRGYERPTTPFLEWLAERAVVFESCYAQAAWTKPSMASMLSSQYPSTTGIYKLDQRLDDRFQTWPEQLQEHGWFTAGFSTNIVMGGLLSNYAQGFDHFVESTGINQGDPIRFASGSAAKLNEEVFAWMDRGRGQWPMLLYLHSVDPHEEYEPEPQYLEEFADPARHEQFREEWRELLASRPPIPGLYVTQDNFDRTGIDAASFIEHASDCYDADILANDDQMQLLWDRLQQDGWGEDFVFVFTSDHGEEFFDHGGTCHGYSLYDEMVRVPLMIYAPGLVEGGQRIAAPVRSLDLYPTLCELLGVEAPAGLQGRSLVPLMRGEATAATEIYSQHREDPVVRLMGQGSGVMTSLRAGKWKFILNELSSQMIEKPRFELYDLEADPRERRNLAGEHPELVREFEAKVLAFQAAHPTPEQRPAAQAEEEMDEAVLEELRELGYIGEEEEEEEPAPDLWPALKEGDLEQVRGLLDAGADPNQREAVLGTTPLFSAAAAGDLELLKLLLARGAELDGLNLDGTSALIGAAFLGRVDTARHLIEQGADRAVVNTNGDDARKATTHPWEITSLVMQMLGLDFAQEAVERGRRGVLELLEP